MGEGRLLLKTNELLLTAPAEGKGFWFCDENIQVLLTQRYHYSLSLSSTWSLSLALIQSPPPSVHPRGFQPSDQTGILALCFLEVEEVKTLG